MIKSTAKSIWYQLKQTGRKVAKFLLDECTAADVTILIALFLV